ncbi:Regulatory protein [Nymphaea thermarum]|nr:Regulatory protein [Nymphaea thermarum]
MVKVTWMPQLKHRKGIETDVTDNEVSGASNICRASSSSGPVRYIPGSYSKTEGDGNPSSVNHPKDLSNDRPESKSSQHEDSPDNQSTHEMPRLKNALGNQKLSANRTSGPKLADWSRRLEDGKVLKFQDLVGYAREDRYGDLMREIETQANGSENSNETAAFEVEVSANRLKREAETFAIEALAGRAHTVIELNKKLRGKKYSSDIVESVISDFQARGLLNDYLYAETVARSRWLSMTWGPRRIKQVFDEDNAGDGYAHIGMSSSSINSLLERMSKHWLRAADIPEEKRKARIMRWLQYRGFDWGVIAFILKKLEANYPSNGPTDS